MNDWKIYRVFMLAFRQGEIRTVRVPETEVFGKKTERILDRVFYWGQNDFQPQMMPSVSVGDVIEIRTEIGPGSWFNEYWMVEDFGFRKMARHEFHIYSEMTREERWAVQYHKVVWSDQTGRYCSRTV